MDLLKKIKQKWHQAKSDPREIIPYINSLIRGKIFSTKMKMLNGNVSIGSKFRARSAFKIKGPGRVIIGDNVTVDLSFLRVPSIITHTPDACVTIGDGCYLGGVRISCVGTIKIGEEGLLGSTTLIDSDIIPIDGMKIDQEWIKQHSAPIVTGAHCWFGTNTFVLQGATLGDECVLGAGATVRDKTFPEKSLLLGNPVRKIGKTR
jgi:acetyltransferase-like isoleucine patch superfamily enzyme